MNFFLAFVPILVVLILMLILHWSSPKAGLAGWLAGIAVALLALGVAFTSCGKKGSNELVIQSYMSDEAPKAAFQALSEQFMKENLNIKVTINTTAHEQFKTQLMNYLTAKEAPDVKITNAAIAGGLRTPQMRENFTRIGAEPAPGTPADFANFIVAESRKWGAIAKTAGIEPQ